MHGYIGELRAYHHDKAHHLHELQAFAVRLTEDAGAAEKDELTELFSPFRNDPEMAHHRNEELILLHLQETDAPIHRKVHEISADHAAFDRIIVKLIRMISNEDVSRSELGAALQDFVAIYHDHASGEENIFFPMADEYLTPRSWRAVGAAWISSRRID